jgi:hypothetical protein
MVNQGKDDNRSSLIQDLLTNENLTYDLPSNATVVVEKNQKIFSYDKTTYGPNERMVITLNSGSDFIDGRNSYMAFNLAVTGGTTDAQTDFITFGEGSACNLFSEILIRSRDGSILENVRDLNSLCAIKGRWMRAQDFVNGQGSMMGYSPSRMVNDSGATSPLLAEAAPNTYLGVRQEDFYSKQEVTTELLAGKVFVIPMQEISELFGSTKLLPSYLMAGLRIELVLAPVTTVFYLEGTPATATTYTITQPEIRLQTLKLSESILNQLTTNASNGGLIVTLNTWDVTPHNSLASASTANVEVRRNVSQVLGVIVKNRLTANLSLATADSMASEATHSVTSYRFRLGSTFVPNSSITNKVEHYALAQLAMNKFKRTDAENSISLKSYLTQGRSIIASDLERSAIDLSGVAISNSKILGYEAVQTAVARQVDVYIQFTRVLTCFLTNVLVED